MTRFVISSTDTQGCTALDDETRVAVQVLQALKKQQSGAGYPPCSTQSTPPGKAEYFEGGGLMKNIRESVRRSKMHNSPVSQPPTPITPAGLISTIKVGILPPAKVLADDLTKATLREGSSNVLKVTPKFIGWKTMKESTHSLDANCLSRKKDNMVLSSRQGARATCPSAPDSSRDAAGGSGHSPGGSKQEVAHLTIVVSDDGNFTNDCHQIIPMEEVFAVPSFLRDDLQGFNKGYLLPTEVTAFRGTYYHESGDVRLGYTGVSSFNYPLD